MAISPGSNGNIVVVRVMYQWPIFLKPFSFNLANLSNGNRLVDGDRCVPERASMTAGRPRLLSCPRRPQRFAGDRQAIAATEFALILPIMLVVFVGVAEVGQAISISRKVTITVRTVTDLVTQYSALSSTDMTNLLGAAAQIIAPYPSSKLTLTVSEVSTDSSSNATITWSTNPTAYPAGTKVTLPSGLSLPNITVIWGKAQYAYTPVLGDNIIGATTLSDQIYMDPAALHRHCLWQHGDDIDEHVQLPRHV